MIRVVVVCGDLELADWIQKTGFKSNACLRCVA